MNDNNSFFKHILDKINKSSAKNYHHKTISQIKTPKNQFFLLFTPKRKTSNINSLNSIQKMSINKSNSQKFHPIFSTVRKESRRLVSPFKFFSNEKKVVPLLYRNFCKDETNEKLRKQYINNSQKKKSISNLLWSESKDQNWNEKIQEEASEVIKINLRKKEIEDNCENMKKHYDKIFKFGILLSKIKGYGEKSEIGYAKSFKDYNQFIKLPKKLEKKLHEHLPSKNDTNYSSQFFRDILDNRRTLINNTNKLLFNKYPELNNEILANLRSDSYNKRKLKEIISKIEKIKRDSPKSMSLIAPFTRSDIGI